MAAETWGSDPLTGKVREIIHLPGNSWLPFIASVFLAVLCLSLLNKFYWVALGATLATVVLLRWSWENGAHPPPRRMPIPSPVSRRCIHAPSTGRACGAWA